MRKTCKVFPTGCIIKFEMLKAIHKLRTRRFRLLASLLVVMAILCNGFGFAQAHSTTAITDCCPEMMTGEMSSQNGDDSCPPSNIACDDQCMLRCFTANGLLTISFSIPAGRLVTTTLPSLKVSEHVLAERGPDLRPPIYS